MAVGWARQLAYRGASRSGEMAAKAILAKRRAVTGVLNAATGSTAQHVASSAAKVGIGLIGVGGALTMGAGLAALAPIGALYEAKYTSGQWKRAEEAAVMSRLIANSQVGPFGTGDRPYGMSSNYGNSAGMTLALHYARNGTRVRDPFMQMMGSLAGGQYGKFIGSF